MHKCLLDRFDDTDPNPFADEGLHEGGEREVGQFFHPYEWAGVDVNDVFGAQLKIRGVAVKDSVGVNCNGFRAVYWTADDDDASLVSALAVATAGRDGRYDGCGRGVGDGSGQANLADHV